MENPITHAKPGFSCRLLFAHTSYGRSKYLFGLIYTSHSEKEAIDKNIWDPFSLALKPSKVHPIPSRAAILLMGRQIGQSQSTAGVGKKGSLLAECISE